MSYWRDRLNNQIICLNNQPFCLNSLDLRLFIQFNLELTFKLLFLMRFIFFFKLKENRIEFNDTQKGT